MNGFLHIEVAYNDNNIVVMNYDYETKHIIKVCISYSICYAPLLRWYQFRFTVGKISTHMCMCCDDLSNRSLCNSYVKDHSRYGLNQWGATLHCNVVSHWLIPCPEWSLYIPYIVVTRCRAVSVSEWRFLSRPTPSNPVYLPTAILWYTMWIT